jgi:hypothetical protein
MLAEPPCSSVPKRLAKKRQANIPDATAFCRKPVGESGLGARNAPKNTTRHGIERVGNGDRLATPAAAGRTADSWLGGPVTE